MRIRSETTHNTHGFTPRQFLDLSFCDVLDSWLMLGPHPYWMLTISKKGKKRHGSVPSSSHMAKLSYPLRARTWNAMDRYQSSYVCRLRATIPAMLKHTLTPPPRETYSHSWVPQQETERCFLACFEVARCGGYWEAFGLGLVVDCTRSLVEGQNT